MERETFFCLNQCNVLQGMGYQICVLVCDGGGGGGRWRTCCSKLNVSAVLMGISEFQC